MKYYFLFILLFILSACMDSPDIPRQQEILAKEKIQKNKDTALAAKEAYITLQKLREND